MTVRPRIALALAPLVLAASPGMAEPLVWGVQAEQMEYRIGGGDPILAWDFDALLGTDDLKMVWRSTAEYAPDDDRFETLENQFRLQAPISDFFDLVAGAWVDTPDGPDRAAGVVGVHGLAPQWLEIDADLFLSDRPFTRLEVDYEALITNRVILVPSLEVDIPFADDRQRDIGAWGPMLEVGARLSYDLVDRLFSPYIGVHYEGAFGETGDRRRAAGEDDSQVFFVIGSRILF